MYQLANDSITDITWWNLSLSMIPVIVVIGILWRWKLNAGTTLYGMGRMLLQLFLIGFFLEYIFETSSSPVVMGVLGIMLLAAGWIALRTSNKPRKSLYLFALISIVLGGGSILILISQVVLDLDPWYLPRFMIPLAGMIFAGSMNAISLAVDRLEAELSRQEPFRSARGTALQASLIPITNSLFSVGLVSIPGMMTGQILAKVDPFVAARYQIMVMAMLFASSGLSVVMFLIFTKRNLYEAE